MEVVGLWEEIVAVYLSYKLTLAVFHPFIIQSVRASGAAYGTLAGPVNDFVSLLETCFQRIAVGGETETGIFAEVGHYHKCTGIAGFNTVVGHFVLRRA